MALKKISMNVDEKLLEKVELYAESIGVNRSAAFAFLLQQGLLVAFYPDMLEKLTELAKK